MKTDADAVDASMVNVVVLLLLGLGTLSAGLYGKVGSPPAADAAVLHPAH